MFEAVQFERLDREEFRCENSEEYRFTACIKVCLCKQIFTVESGTKKISRISLDEKNENPAGRVSTTKNFTGFWKISKSRSQDRSTNKNVETVRGVRQQ